jgi:hypothetical protein
MSRQFYIFVIVLLVATAIYYPFSPAGRQARNMRLAQDHIQLLEPYLRNDSRFDEVHLSGFTGSGGSLMVRGRLATQADVDEVRRIVEQSNPPCPVVLYISVARATTATTKPVD